MNVAESRVTTGAEIAEGEIDEKETKSNPKILQKSMVF